MPEGPAIFETSGAWEDYSTPARDMRLLIAIGLVTDFPSRVAENPTAYTFRRGHRPGAVVEQLRRFQRDYLAGHHVTYVRSNGSPMRLSLADVIGRQRALEIGYNPNDCIEIRWGAPEGSQERASCRRHAPEDQQELMRQYREWFHTRTRPPRL